VEQLTKVVRTLGAEGDEEVRTLVVRTLVWRARRRGLSCAQPLSERRRRWCCVWSGDGRVRRYGRGGALAVGRARRRSRGARAGSEAGELLALLDWSEEEDALYLLTDAKCGDVERSAVAGWVGCEGVDVRGWCRRHRSVAGPGCGNQLR